MIGAHILPSLFNLKHVLSFKKHVKFLEYEKNLNNVKFSNLNVLKNSPF